MGVVGQELSLLTGVGHVVPSVVGVEVARRGVRPAGHQVAVPHVTISCNNKEKVIWKPIIRRFLKSRLTVH